MTVAVADLCESANTRASLCNKTGIRVDAKMSLIVSHFRASPACIARVRVSRPNFRAPCGRTKL